MIGLKPLKLCPYYIGQIREFACYYDRYARDDCYMIGRKQDSNVRFAIGNARTLEEFEKAIDSYLKRT